MNTKMQKNHADGVVCREDERSVLYEEGEENRGREARECTTKLTPALPAGVAVYTQLSEPREYMYRIVQT